MVNGDRPVAASYASAAGERHWDAVYASKPANAVTWYQLASVTGFDA